METSASMHETDWTCPQVTQPVGYAIQADGWNIGRSLGTYTIWLLLRRYI